MPKLRRVFLLVQLLQTAAFAQSALETARMLGDAGPQLHVHNWVLAKPADKPITVMDLTKKLETIFRQQYPEYADSAPARFQFYQMAWRQLLDEMIDTELILADAEEKQVKASDGDIRQQLEQMFGPNVPDKLAELNLTYEDAWQMVRSELVTSEMRHYMVTSRAMLSVGPQKIRNAYQEFREQFCGKDEWTYQLLSLRHSDQQEAEAGAKWIGQLRAEHPDISLQELYDQLIALRKEGVIDGHTAISLSDVEVREITSLADAYKTVLQTIDEGTLSEPTAQRSRRDGSTVYRIFALHKHQIEEAPSFAQMEIELQNSLLQSLAGEEEQKYREHLRSHYGVDSDYIDRMIPAEFEPYELR